MMTTKSNDELSITVTFRISCEDIDSFDAVASARRISRAALLRECVLEKVNEWNNKTTTEELPKDKSQKSVPKKKEELTKTDSGKYFCRVCGQPMTEEKWKLYEGWGGKSGSICYDCQMKLISRQKKP